MVKIVESRKDDDAQFIRQKLNEYNFTHVPPDNHEELCLLVRNGDDIIGGLLGGTYWKWMHVGYLWVDENERYNGVGTSLLERAKEIAIKRGCKNAHVETHDFQNLAFHEERGYRVFGKLADLPEGHTKYYLQKRLAI
jgi:GNAT superfamily N-acetyltransferase